MNPVSYDFIKVAGRILNSTQTDTLLITGNIHDLFAFTRDGQTDYISLADFITETWQVANRITVVYELNGPIRFLRKSDREKFRDAWLKWRTGYDANTLAIESMLATSKVKAQLDSWQQSFESNMTAAIGNPTVALEVLRQMCICSRTELVGRLVLPQNLIILIEEADMMIPEGEISRLSDSDRHRISICQDWFSDPGFMNSDDSVILFSESRSLINQRVARLPQILEVAVPAPDEAARQHFINWFDEKQPEGRKLQTWSTGNELARYTAGLSIHALMQMLKGACYEQRILTLSDVISKVEQHIQSQLGEDIVEFKKPSHRLTDLVGNQKLKKFLKDELIPRFRSMGPDALPGAVVCGPIGGGKTFIFEAVASELDMIVLVLKNIRSQWFGQTDVILERLRRVLDALAKVLIFVDEADTQFGGVGPETHATERRLTGKIQAMMSDPRMRGKVTWLLMTARIHLLSPDIRRPGRVGDLIIPVLDPEGEDREAFIRWTIKPVFKGRLTQVKMDQLQTLLKKFSAAGFASLRSELKAKISLKKKRIPLEKILEMINDHLPPPISETRRYQTLQALMNCTRRSLLPDPDVTDEDRETWQRELRELEREGIE